MSNARESRLISTFVAMLEDHQKDFEGFVRDVENVRYCHTPIDGQQLNRCEYALRNMEMRLLTLQNCIADRKGETGDAFKQLTDTRDEWKAMKAKVDGYLAEIHQIVANTSAALRPMRDKLEPSR